MNAAMAADRECQAGKGGDPGDLEPSGVAPVQRDATQDRQPRHDWEEDPHPPALHKVVHERLAGLTKCLYGRIQEERGDDGPAEPHHRRADMDHAQDD